MSNALKTLIDQSSLSQKEWARKFGIEQPYLSLLSNGRRVPSLFLAALIARKTNNRVPMSSWIPADDEDTARTSLGVK